MHVFPVAAALLVLSSPVLAQQASGPVSRKPAATGELSAGLQYQTGDYGTGQRIESASVVIGARVMAGRVVLSGSVPYTRIDAPGNVVTGGGGLLGLPIIVDPSRPATRVRRKGLGDVRLGAAWILPVKAVDVGAIAQVKLPTAGKGLGTGRTDYAFGAEISKPLGKAIPFAIVTYTFPSDPEGYPLRKTWGGQAGVNAALRTGVTAQLAYGYAQNPGAAMAAEQQLSARVTAGITEGLAVSLQGGAGLSRSAPDAAAALQIGWRIF